MSNVLRIQEFTNLIKGKKNKSQTQSEGFKFKEAAETLQSAADRLSDGN